MNRDKLPIKNTYDQEETEEIVKETLFQLELELMNKKNDLRSRKEEFGVGDLKKAAIDREIKQLNRVESLIQDYRSQTMPTYLTECCDAHLNYYAFNTRGQCSECGEDMPDTYEKERTLEDHIKFINEKIEEENNAE